MKYYKAVYTPLKSATDRHRTHMREVSVIFTAPNYEKADAIARSWMPVLFINTGVDFQIGMIDL
jgi:hypothetical protein